MISSRCAKPGSHDRGLAFSDGIGQNVDVFRRRPPLAAIIASLLLACVSANIVFCTNDCAGSIQAVHFSPVSHAPTSPSGDDCLCCCAHVVMPAALQIIPMITAVVDHEVVPPPTIVTSARPLFHPPEIGG